jgi:hypothetical protein
MAKIVREFDPETETGSVIPFRELLDDQQAEVTLATVKQAARLRAEGVIPTGEMFRFDYLVELDDGTVTETTYQGCIGTT